MSGGSRSSEIIRSRNNIRMFYRRTYQCQTRTRTADDRERIDSNASARQNVRRARSKGERVLKWPAAAAAAEETPRQGARCAVATKWWVAVATIEARGGRGVSVGRVLRRRSASRGAPAAWKGEEWCAYYTCMHGLRRWQPDSRSSERHNTFYVKKNNRVPVPVYFFFSCAGILQLGGHYLFQAVRLTTTTTTTTTPTATIIELYDFVGPPRFHRRSYNVTWSPTNRRLSISVFSRLMVFYTYRL